MCFIVLTVQESVRVAAFGLFQRLAKLSVLLCDSDRGAAAVYVRDVFRMAE